MNAATLAALEAGRAYVNVHTTRNPAGEIRGQLPRRRSGSRNGTTPVVTGARTIGRPSPGSLRLGGLHPGRDGVPHTMGADGGRGCHDPRPE